MGDLNEINLDLVCRTCLNGGDDLISIFNTNIGDMLNGLKFIDFVSSDDLPNNLCTKCKELVEQAYNFKLQCEKSDNLLQELLSVKLAKSEILITTEVWLSSTEKSNFSHVSTEENFENDCELMSSEDCNFETDELTCKHCNTTFTDDVLLSTHIDKNHSNKSFEYLNDKNGDVEEIAQEAPDLPKKDDDTISELIDNPVFECAACKQTFNSNHDLNLHVSTHLIVDVFECLECKKTFDSRVVFKRHVKIHMQHKPHVCNICSKGFSESAALNNHIKRHDGVPKQKTHICETCGQGFSGPFYLTIHRRKHTGERPLICPSCGKAFADPRSLKSHCLMHTEDKPFKCDTCGGRSI